MDGFIKLFWICLLPMLTYVAHVFICGVLGWFIGLFFGDCILGILAQCGITGYSMFSIGIFFGFISGFFNRLITFNTKK